MSVTQNTIVAVVGSLHYDIMVDAPDRPRKGETVTGYDWRPKFGGKGGNQAVAARKAGATVRMAGAVGDDDFGRYLLDMLGRSGVDTTQVATLAGVGSGMSVAISDDEGDYGAVIVSGANLRTDPALFSQKAFWQDVGVLVRQNELPEAINVAAAKAARANGAKVCLNAAPYRPLTDEFADLVDVLIVNAIEAEQLGDVAVENLASAEKAALALSERFGVIVVTAGGDGVVGASRGQRPHSLPAIPVKLVSTHGAGDVFVGTLACAMAAGQPLADCLLAANHAAAKRVSMPH